MSWRAAPPLAAALALVWLTALGGCGGGTPTVPSVLRPPPGGVPNSSLGPFVGLVSPDLVTLSHAERERQLRDMATVGVGLVRQTFDWAQIERRPGRYELGPYDALVRDAAAHGITVLPILFDPPPFRSSAPPHPARRAVYPPRDDAALGAFAVALIRRYGPRGTLWAGATARPIRAWQVWNEANLPPYWGGRPDAAAYARMLAVVHPAIRRADPHAEVVTAGLPNSKLGIPFATYLEDLYRAGAGGSFDALAIHPYARTAAGVVSAVEAARALMRRHGDGAKPIWVTEFGWSDAGPGSAFTVGPRGQARRVAATIKTLGRRRHTLGVQGIVYFDWHDGAPYAGAPDFWGLHTGLLDRRGVPKPALSAFRSAVGSVAR